MEEVDEPSFRRFSEADHKWRTCRSKEDKLQDFFKQLDVFPNLFSLKHWLSDTNQTQNILETQLSLIRDSSFPYHLEKARCQNLIIFLQFVLGHKQEAMTYCNDIQKTMKKSIIFLTLKAVLQWEFNNKKESKGTLKALQDAYKSPDYNYLVAVAEAEKGYLLISIGPRGFLAAMDLLQKAIDACPGSHIYLWKYDLGLAIRRNFNIIAYSEHPKLSASALATTAAELLNETAESCPNNVYKAWGLVEMGRLIAHLKIFADGFCREEDKKTLKRLCLKYDQEGTFFERALEMECSKTDHYVLRECGRFYFYAGNLCKALSYLDKACSCHIHNNSIVFQLYGKIYRKMYLKGMEFIGSAQESQLRSANTEGSSASLRDTHLNNLHSDVGLSGYLRPCQCEPGTCPVQQNASEAKCLEADMDQTPFMDDAGHFLTTQTDGIEGFQPYRLDSHLANGQHVLDMETNDRSPPMNRPVTRSVWKSHILSSTQDYRSPVPQNNLKEIQRQELESEFDDNPFMDESGQFVTTQSDGIEGIQFGHPPRGLNCHQAAGPGSSRQCWDDDGHIAANSQHPLAWSSFRRHPPPVRVHSNEERLLYADFDERSKVFQNPDGTSTQPSGIGSLPHHVESFNNESKSPRLRSPYSFPPTAKTREKKMKSVLKCKTSQHYLDPLDCRIHAAELFFLKAVKKNPANFAALYDTGVLFEDEGKREKALKYYELIIISECSSSIDQVNAYERSGLCLMALSKDPAKVHEAEKLKARAEDMFMRSLVECSKAVAHMPEVSANRAKLWGSYPSLLQILRGQPAAKEGGSTKRLSKEATAHETVGNYLQAIEVYSHVMHLALTVKKRTRALCCSVKNHLRLGKVKEAKFILDLFLLPASEDRDLILKANDADTRRLRDMAAEVYVRAARQALMTGNISDLHDARASFQSALALTGKLQDFPPDEAADGDLVQLQRNGSGLEGGGRRGLSESHGGAEDYMMEERFEVCIFYEDSSLYDEDVDDSFIDFLKTLSTAMARIMKEIFGLRVSVNGEGIKPGHLSFNSELHMAESAAFVMLIVAPGSRLSPRMNYIVDTVLRSLEKDRVLPVLVSRDVTNGSAPFRQGFSDRSGGDGQHCLPPPLRVFEPYYGAEECLGIDVHNASQHVDTIDHLFSCLLKGRAE